MDDDLVTIDGVRALPVPVPPMLERALAYADHAHGASARLICFSWEPTGADALLH